MAYAFVNKFGKDQAAGSTLSISITIATGENVIVVVQWHAGGGPVISVSSVSDGTNTYSQIGSTFTDGSSDAWGMWYAKNVTGGTFTLTVTFSAATSADNYCAGFRYTGLDPTTSPTTFYGNEQATPGTGTDAVTTGLMTVSNQPAMVFGLCYDFAHGTGNVSSGTGFTSRGLPISGLDILGEDKRVTSTSSVAATFTTGINDQRTTVGAIFPEPIAAADTLMGQAFM